MDINRLIITEYSGEYATTNELELSQQERKVLEQMRDHHTKSYARERAAALLKIAGGHSATQVAYTGLLKKRYPHAVCEWVSGCAATKPKV